MQLLSAIIYNGKSILNTIRLNINQDVIPLIGHSSKNWGDAFNPYLYEMISGRKFIIINDHTFNVRGLPVYSGVGSTLQNANERNCGNDKLIVWGTGFISESSLLKVRPKKICAVRGPLTYKILQKQGIDSPKIFGDPALLYPYFYKPNINKKYRLGIVPHYIDKNNKWLDKIMVEEDVLIIDIEARINDVVNQICSCHSIASSSLHGLIIADAYGVDSCWIKMSNLVIGDHFKFIDYFESVGKVDKKPIIIDADSTINDILNNMKNEKIEIDIDQLISACPFNFS